MSDDFYSELQGIATELLEEFQQGTVTLTRVTPGEVDPETPWIEPEPETSTITLAAAVKGVSEELVDGATILSTDLEIVCAVPESLVPQLSDAIAIDGKTVSLLRIMPKPAAGTPVAYRLIVRG